MHITEQQQQNLNFIKKHASSASNQQLKKCHNQPTLLTVNKNGKITTIQTVGTNIYLHSIRNPVAEAQRQIKRWTSQQTTALNTIICIGVAGAYHIQELYQITPLTKIIIIEPHPQALFDILPHISIYSHRKISSQIYLICNQNPQIICSELQQQLSNITNLKPAIFYHPRLKQIHAKLYNNIHNQIVKQINSQIANTNTLQKNRQLWFNNALDNLSPILQATNLANYKNKFQNLPAMIVAAGPSLNQMLPIIKQQQQNLLIITVSTAYNALINSGIIPDLTIAVDASPTITKQFENKSKNSILLAPAHINPNVIKLFPNKIIYFKTQTIPYFNQWLDKLIPQIPQLEIGGTVTLTAIDAAQYLGCNPIYISGLDLSCQKDGTTHAKLAITASKKRSINTLTTVIGNWKQAVTTTEQYKIYINLLGEYAKKMQHQKQSKIININSDGAAIPYLSCIKPQCFVNTILPNINKQKINLTTKPNMPLIKSKNKINTFLTQTKQQLQKIIDIAKHINTNNDAKLYQQINKKLHENYLATILLATPLANTTQKIINNKNCEAKLLAKSITQAAKNILKKIEYIDANICGNKDQ